MAEDKVWTKEEQEAALLDTLSIFTDLIPSGSKLAIIMAKIGGAIGFKTFMSKMDELIEAFKELISDALDVANDWVDWDDLKQKAIAAAIEGGIKQLNKNLKAQYPWIPDIVLVDSTIDGLLEGVGGWLADVVNLKLSEGLGHEVQAFSTFYPPVHIVDELDVFLVDEINTKTGLNITSIVKNPNLKEELIEAIQTKFAQAIADKLATQKARLIDEMANLEIYGASRQQRIKTIDGIIDEVIQMILQRKVIGFNFDGKAFIQQQYKKQLNRKHQAAYRRLHREERRWVLRDTPINN